MTTAQGKRRAAYAGVALGAVALAYFLLRSPKEAPPAPEQVVKVETAEPAPFRRSVLATIPGSPCNVKGTLSNGTGRLVRVYSEVAGIDIDGELSSDRAGFEVDVPEQGAMVVSAVSTDGRSAEVRAFCGESGLLDVALKFPPARKSFTTIRGQCVYLETGAPVAAARVRAKGWSIITDDEGRFEVRPSGGVHEVACAKDGDESETQRVIAYPGTEREVVLRLAARATVIGTVHTEDGSPVEGAQLTARDRDRKEYFARSNADGGFELRGLQPGAVGVDAQYEGLFAEAHVVAKVGLPYAEVHLVVAGGTRTLRGRVIDAQGPPIEGARVTAYGGARVQIERGAFTDGDGRFVIAGLWDWSWVRADAEGYVSNRVRIEAPERTGEVQLQLTRACSTKFRVLPEEPRTAVRIVTGNGVSASGETGDVITLADDAGGQRKIEVHTMGAVSRRVEKLVNMCTEDIVEVNLDPELDQGTIEVEVVDEHRAPVESVVVSLRRRWQHARSDQNGIARFDGVPEGSYAVYVEQGDEAEVQVRPRETARAQLTVKRADGEVSGVVSALGRPVEGAAIRASCGRTGGARSLEDAEVVARSDGAGAFSFDPRDGTVCEVRAEHATEGTSDTAVLRAGGLPAQLALRPLGAVEGRVVERTSGSPVPSYALTITPIGRASGVDARSMYVTDSSGRFRVDGVPSGRLSIAVTSERGRGHVEVERPAGQSVRGIEIPVFERGSVSGRVVSKNGPVAGARIRVDRLGRGGAGGNGSSDAEGRFEIAVAAGDQLRVSVSRDGFYPWGSAPFDLDAAYAQADLGDIKLSPRTGNEEKEGGIGIRYEPDPSGVRVVEFLGDSPARDAGLEIGDVIVGVDGVPAARMPMIDVVLRGAVGSAVVLEIERGTSPRFFVTVTRRAVGLPPIPNEAR